MRDDALYFFLPFLRALEAQAARDLAAVSAGKDGEAETLVRTYNEKYKAMLHRAPPPPTLSSLFWFFFNFAQYMYWHILLWSFIFVLYVDHRCQNVYIPQTNEMFLRPEDRKHLKKRTKINNFKRNTTMPEKIHWENTRTVLIQMLSKPCLFFFAQRFFFGAATLLVDLLCCVRSNLYFWFRESSLLLGVGSRLNTNGPHIPRIPIVLIICDNTYSPNR